MVKVLQLLGWITITAALLLAIWFHTSAPAPMSSLDIAHCWTQAVQAGQDPKVVCDLPQAYAAVAGPMYNASAIYALVGGAVTAVLWFFLAAVLRNQERTIETLERLQRGQP